MLAINLILPNLTCTLRLIYLTCDQFIRGHDTAMNHQFHDSVVVFYFGISFFSSHIFQSVVGPDICNTIGECQESGPRLCIIHYFKR